MAEPLLRSGGRGQQYALIYKTGDDLRQDQLVVQLFELMDGLLKRENLDLRLTPYRYESTSADVKELTFRTRILPGMDCSCWAACLYVNYAQAQGCLPPQITPLRIRGQCISTCCHRPWQDASRRGICVLSVHVSVLCAAPGCCQRRRTAA